MKTADPDSTIFNDLIAGIYEAGIHPELWGEVMPRISNLFDGAGIGFGVVNLKRGLLLFPEHNFSPDCMRGVAERYHTPANNPGIRLASSTAPPTFAPLESIMSNSDLIRSDFYNDLMRPYRFFHGLCANLYRDPDHLVALSSFRTTAAGSYEGAEISRFALLLPHLYCSLKVFVRLSAMDALLGAQKQIIDRLPHGVIVTDAIGRVGLMNSAAETIIAEQDGLELRNGVLSTSRRAEVDGLARLIAEAAGRGVAKDRPNVRRTGAMQVSRPSMRQPLPLVVAPMQFDRSTFQPALSVSITVSNPERQPETTAEVLSRLYSLTPAEANLAILLIRGHSPQTAARELNVSITTIRTHIRHLLLKTQTERVTEVVRRIMSGPGAIAP
jgi:DNA-binding CsgD family transcriptional regulator/PAS domain-containing protein